MRKDRKFTIDNRDNNYCITFYAMASCCEIVIETSDILLAQSLAQLVSKEVWRIEDKYNRYSHTSVCSEINKSAGQIVSIDKETFLLLNFANTCFELSQGLFDITSGVLRKIWHFDCSDNIPDKNQVLLMQKNVGWQKVTFDESTINLPKGMELDFGGIGKEYAVDRCIQLTQSLTNVPILINLGGDLASTSIRSDNKPWQVGIEHPGFEQQQPMIVLLYKGALATSGDAKRYLLKNGKRYSHILDAKTGWPIENAPKSITVSAPKCIQAGILATLSMLQGSNAEQFLDEQEIKYWAIR